LDHPLGLLLTLPLGLTLAAAAQYPFHERLTLFLLPIVILALAYGA